MIALIRRTQGVFKANLGLNSKLANLLKVGGCISSVSGLKGSVYGGTRSQSGLISLNNDHVFSNSLVPIL